ncbi:hypothetical protein ABBQ38_005480 [Trebouxia sp. C0009 RCD-2024]
MLLRIRLSSFLAGVAVAGTFSLYQIRQDIQKSHELLSAQAEGYDKGLEQRVSNLEATVSQLQK